MRYELPIDRSFSVLVERDFLTRFDGGKQIGKIALYVRQVHLIENQKMRDCCIGRLKCVAN